MEEPAVQSIMPEGASAPSNTTSADVDLSALFDTPQLATDEFGVHRDATGRVWEATEIVGEVTYRPAAEDVDRESKVWDRDMLVMPPRTLSNLTTAGRAAVLDAALAAAETAHRLPLPTWGTGDGDGEGSYNGPSASLGGKVAIGLGWGADSGTEIYVDALPLTMDMTLEGLRNHIAELSRIADLAEQSLAAEQTAKVTR